MRLNLRTRKLLVVAVGVLCAVLVAQADELKTQRTASNQAARSENPDPEAGRIKSNTERCQECHDHDGNSSSPGVPKLAGLSYDYIMKQLGDFQSRSRRHDIMNAMAAGIGKADLADLAAFFSRQKRDTGGGAKGDANFANLFEHGDTARGIAACVSCHGNADGGTGPGGLAYPLLNGQQRFYVREQLLDWKVGSRTNSPGGIMNDIAQRLSDDEIESLSEYISKL